MPEQFEHGYALLVAVSDNIVTDWVLPDVAKDATALQEVLIHPQRCAYAQNNVKVLLGKDATRDGILEGLAWLKGCLSKDKDATAVIFYSGHGWQDIAAAPTGYYLIRMMSMKKGALYGSTGAGFRRRDQRLETASPAGDPGLLPCRRDGGERLIIQPG